MSAHHGPRLFHISNLAAEITDRKVSEAYVVFSVSGSNTEKQKSQTVSGSQGAFSWGESFIDIEIPDPTNASLEVKAFQRRSLISDRLLGEFALTLAHPGATANLSGNLAKKGNSNGSVSFKIRPKNSRAASKHGEVITNRDSAYPSTQTLNKLPSRGTAANERNLPDSAHDRAASAEAAASAKSNAVAAEAERRTNDVSQQAEGRTVATVNATEQKLQQFKQDMAEGAHPRYAPEPSAQQSGAPAGTTSGQGAFSKAVGVPPEAGTANDEAGAGASHNTPYGGALGGASGAVAGPVAPTGQGGVLTGTGADTSGPEKTGTMGQQVKGAAANAANRAQDALNSAKQSFK